jgi:hypothetical protein
MPKAATGPGSRSLHSILSARRDFGYDTPMATPEFLDVE